MKCRLVVVAALSASAALGAPVSGDGAAPDSEAAVYRLAGPSPWKQVRPLENPGYRVALSSADGTTLSVRVVVDGRPLRDDQEFPVPSSSLPAELRGMVSRPADDGLDRLARSLTRGATSALEAVERVVGFTARRIRYDHPGSVPETAASCLARGRGSCVGRSLLAEELLARAGIPARQVTGILTASTPGELSEESRAFWSPEISGVRHRWIEAYVPGLGWVASDPAGLANTVTARYLALSGPPGPEFGLAVVSRTAELRRPRLDLVGQGVALGRPRSASAGSSEAGFRR
jgi:transglutaminase-like putative cysteine protease